MNGYTNNRKYDQGSDIRFNAMMLKSNLCDYNDVNIPLKETITMAGAGAHAVLPWSDERNEQVILKNCGPFINCVSQIHNTQVDNAEYLNIVMPMYNVIECSVNYTKKLKVYSSAAKVIQMIK